MRQSLDKSNHAFRYVPFRSFRERRSIRFISALLEGLACREIAEPATGVPKVKRMCERRGTPDAQGNLAECLDGSRPDDRIADTQKPYRKFDQCFAVRRSLRISREFLRPVEPLFARRLDDLFACPQGNGFISRT